LDQVLNELLSGLYGDMSLKQIGLALAIDTSSTSLEVFEHLHPTLANTLFSLNLAALWD
jgi:hypothetical protein